tara:strand:- start:314 stop:1321 length:1008 start_codon:yes stop_codon:yes gene_type:complete
MNTLVYVFVGIIIILYIIDKKEVVKPEIEDFDIDEEGMIVPKVLTNQEKKLKRRNEIYKDILVNIQDINPLKTYRVWTYIEIQNESRNIPLSYTKFSIPVYFQKCIDLMKKNIPELIILTPMNIKEFLPNFDIDMNKDSDIPLKLRVDILFASILKDYGGICVSPGTVIYDLSNPLSLLHKYEVVTFGSNPNIIQAKNHIYFPNNYTIGFQKNSTIVKEYLRFLIMYKNDNSNYNFKTASSSDILSYLLELHRPTQYHYGTEFDGTYNSKHQTIPLKNYLGTETLNFLNKDKLMLINFPYDILLKSPQYQWFINLSEMQFAQSNLLLKRLLLKDI